MAKKILLLHGPNLNLLGTREPNIYGSSTLQDINSHLEKLAEQFDVHLSIYQENSESAMIEHIHEAYSSKVNFIIINAAAFTHTSVAIRDALSAVCIPFIEVHLSNIYKRENFRHVSYLSDIALGMISGLGLNGYEAALRYAIDY
ncbi:type II 3-dehydroquinate dehydratase [Candidatus Kinetoplastidibacterium crithidiae]|uniref:3-dehydroquinate dehydratase n=1 Tax=Candidatus Kinetoplastidibacterium crithidiae TCC036E TaxID=1208918 RepID=M1LXG5_9PROT|nr:type II 3-dehydroquinate dehydratase [Candidatus Kinetoplastibacterium crithidii]AFZ82899.1 3-dehydroquinate dehydratase [Candidatus Kinetoplastibacterium crithidii (ex Angomonas deanei ATCC 30255)]AGF47899.1 3-dehydroquinate dehydratase II [Candidatus Kinetoplastibacterium crithidii TCC036E]